jgi:AraC-like DNA-binding protein
MTNQNLTHFVISPINRSVVIPLSNKIPALYEASLVEGFDPSYIELDYCKILLQQKEIDGCIVQVIHADVQRAAVFSIESRQPFGVAILNLQGSISLSDDRLGDREILIKGKVVQFYAFPYIDSVFGLNGGKYLVVLVHCTPAYMQGFKFVSLLELQMENGLINRTWVATLFPEIRKANNRVLYLIHQLLNCKINDDADTTQSVLLTSLLYAMQRVPEKTTQKLLSMSEIEAVIAAKNIIDKDIHQLFTVGELAKQVGLSQRKLSIGFAEMLRLDIREYIRTERLQQAKYELENTGIPMKVISHKAGYRNISNFCTAFKKLYGHTPYTCRTSEE